jgi:hypothetical protein
MQVPFSLASLVNDVHIFAAVDNIIGVKSKLIYPLAKGLVGALWQLLSPRVSRSVLFE